MLLRREMLSGLSMALFGAGCGGARHHARSTSSETAIIDTPLGRLQGIRRPRVMAFLGVPYGEDTRNTRFRAPDPVKPWSGVRDATAYGPMAPQAHRSPHPLARSWKDLSNGVSEDCLRLNVWTSSVSGKRPVLVWFHGGGFGAGSGNNALYDGENLVERGDVVLVTVTHRLNVFGYLYLGDMAPDLYPDSGNVGQLDLVEALRWIKENISAFGGDPDNVVIFGESGGGGKLSYLMGMPSGDGLYHRAIIQSGAFLEGADADVATEKARRFLQKLGVSRNNLGKLEDLPMRDFINTLGSASTVAERMAYTPVTDGGVIPRDPFEPAARPHTAQIPLLIGKTRWEYIYQLGQEDPTRFVLTADELPEKLAAAFSGFSIGADPGAVIAWYRENRPGYTPSDILFGAVSDGRIGRKAAALADRHAALGGAPTYAYRLDWETPQDGGRWKSPHAMDLPFVFDNVDIGASMTGDGDAARKLAADMSGSWIAFAKSGSPQTKRLPDWPEYTLDDRATMIFDTECKVVSDPDGDIRTYWSR